MFTVSLERRGTKNQEEWKMILKSTLSFMLLLLSFCFLIPSWATKTVQTDSFLFTQDEAAKLNLSELEGREWSNYLDQHFTKYLSTRGAATKGPRIKVTYPSVKISDSGQTIETQSPTKLIVEFIENAFGGLVDMSTLEVIGKRGWFKKSLTEKLRPYVKGKVIQASDIKIPTGKFHLEVSIADRSGVKTVENYILVVR
jgi:hypothetical protein